MIVSIIHPLTSYCTLNFIHYNHYSLFIRYRSVLRPVQRWKYFKIKQPFISRLNNICIALVIIGIIFQYITVKETKI